MKKIKLTNGLYSMVDNDIYYLIKKFKWFGVMNGGRTTYYPAICIKFLDGNWRLLRLHHLVVGQPLNRKLQIDHIDTNGLNNQRSNLRIVTHRENVSNTKNRQMGKTASACIGVSLSHSGKRWVAKINNRYLGTFDTEQEASTTYKLAVRRLT